MSDSRTATLRAALAGMIALAVAMGVGRFVYTPILPHMLEAGSLSTATGGWLAGSNFLGYLVGALLASLGGLERRRSNWFFAGLVASALSTFLFGLVDAYETQLALRFISGVASAFTLVFGTAIVLEKLAEGGRPSLIAVHFAGVGLGIAVSAIMVSVLVSQGMTWPRLWFASGVLSALGVAAIWSLLPGSPAVRRKSAINPAVSHSAPPFSAALRLFIVGYGFFGFGYIITATFINTIAQSDPLLVHLEPWIWVIVGLAGMPSTWFWNSLVNRFGFMRIYTLACGAEAFGIALLWYKSAPVTLILSAILVGGTFMAVTAIGLAKARVMAGLAATRAIALMTAAFGLGQVIGPVAAGYGYEFTGSFRPALAMAVIGLVCTIVFSIMAQLADRD